MNKVFVLADDTPYEGGWIYSLHKTFEDALLAAMKENARYMDIQEWDFDTNMHKHSTVITEAGKWVYKSNG